MNRRPGRTLRSSLVGDRRLPVLIPLALLAAFLCLPAGAVELTILYWSDGHSHNLPELGVVEGDTVEVGGAAALAGMVNRLRAAAPRPLVLVAGDEFTGTPVSSRSRGLSQVEILNAVGIDAFVPGNHEFDHGWRSLLDVMKEARFPVLLANVVCDTIAEPLFAPDTALNCMGVAVGIAGLICRDFTSSVAREGILGISGLDPVEACRLFVARRWEACDLLVALTHIGWEGDSAMAAAVEGLDVIVGGHSHTPIDPPREVNGVLIVQSDPYYHTLGRLVVDVDTAAGGVTGCRGDLLPVRGEFAAPDREVERLVRRLEKRYSRGLERRIGTLVTDWNLNPGQPSNLGQWAVDVMLLELRSRASEGIAMAVINDGNLRASLPRGPITERDIWEICPFDNSLVIFQVTGDELVHVVRRQLLAPREFLHWSGLVVKAQGGELSSVTVDGVPPDRLSDYAVAATSYLWGQLDSYMGLSPEGRPHFYLPNITQRELLIEAVIRQEVISAPLDDRWDVR